MSAARSKRLFDAMLSPCDPAAPGPRATDVRTGLVPAQSSFIRYAGVVPSCVYASVPTTATQYLDVSSVVVIAVPAPAVPAVSIRMLALEVVAALRTNTLDELSTIASVIVDAANSVTVLIVVVVPERETMPPLQVDPPSL